MRSRALLGGAGLLAVVAQLMLSRDQGWLGLLFYVAAGALFGVSVRAKSRSERHTHLAHISAWPAEAKQALASAGLLIILMLFVIDPLNVRWYVWLMQMAALALVFIAARFADDQPRSQLDLPKSPLDISTATTQLLLALILVGGTWVRFRNLADTPFGFWFDEADVGLVARRISDEGYRPLFDRLLPTYDAYLIAGLSKVVGHGIWTVRALSAVLGVATILAGYLVGRELFGKMGGLILAFLIAFGRWSITLSRVGMNNVALPLFALLTLGFLLRGNRRQSSVDYALAGLSAGTGMLFYSSLSTSLIALGIFALYIGWSTGRDVRSMSPQVLIAVIAALVVFTPLLRFIMHDRQEYLRRNGQTALWSDAGRLDNDTLLDGFKDNLANYLPMTHYNGDRNGRHNIPGEPMLAPLVAILSALGLGALAARTDRRLAVLALAWIPLGYLPGLLSLPWEAPNTLRALGILPISLIVATAALIAIGRTVVRSERSKQVVLAMTTLALAATGFGEVTDYFHANRTDNAVWAVHSTGETIAARLTADAPAATYVKTAAFIRDTRQQGYLANDRRPDATFGTATPLPLYVPDGKDALLLTTRESYDIASQAERFYPNAEAIRDFDGLTPDLIVVRVPAADIADSLGWTTSTDNGITTRRGVLIVDAAGNYRFRTSEPVDRLIVDGFDLSPCDSVNAVPLAEGLHWIEIVGNDRAALEWIPGDDAEWSEVPAERIAQQRLLPGGLLTSYSQGLDDAAPPALYEIDASIDLRMHEFALPRPYRMRVSGGLVIPTSGEYEFLLRTDDPVRLSIDGQELFSTDDEFVQPVQTIELTQGIVPIEAIYDDMNGRSEIRLKWSVPGGPDAPEPIPQESFVLPVESRRLSNCGG